MKKRYLLIIPILILIGLLSINVYQNKSISSEKQKVLSDSSTKIGMISLYLKIDKRDENNNPLAGVRFKATTYNNIMSFDSTPYNEYYVIDDGIEGNNDVFETAYKVLSKKQKEVVDSIQTTEDFAKIGYGQYLNCYNLTDMDYASEEFNNQGMDEPPEGYYCTMPLPTYFILEETKTPAGYVKDKQFIPGTISLTYKLLNYEMVDNDLSSPQFRYSDQWNGNIFDVELVAIRVENSYSRYSMEYGKINPEELVGIDMEEALDLWEEYGDSGSFCQMTATAPEVGSFENLRNHRESQQINMQNLCDAPYLVNKKGTVSLEASSYVNNVESITTKMNQTLEYKVVVKNTGSADSIDNTISATIPEGFVYVSGSASDEGVYNNGVITWNVARIKEGQDITLTYKAFASKGVNPGQDYIGTASVDGFALDKPVQSNRTTVRLALQNPNTYAPRATLLIVLMLAAWTVYLVAKQYTKQKQVQE